MFFWSKLNTSLFMGEIRIVVCSQQNQLGNNTCYFNIFV